MPVSQQDVTEWCRRLIEDSSDFPDLDACLDVIPDLDSLADLPAGTRVLVRGDTDVVVGDDGSIDADDDVRLRSLIDTLEFGQAKGWVQLIYGHRGRDPQMSLQPVAEHLQTLLRESGLPKASVRFIGEWLDDKTGWVLDGAAKQVAGLNAGEIAVLENTRRYELEQSLWKAKIADLPALSERIANYANSMRDKLASVHVNEGFAASNRDLSSTIVPLTMDRVALGKYIDGELRDHVTRARKAELVVFSGIKINKLDDLEQILKRGTVRTVIAAGALAIALKKADDDGFEIGLAKDEKQKIHIPPARIDQARRMLQLGRAKGVEFVFPIDFVMSDGSFSPKIPPNGAQFDVGPKTCELFARAVSGFIDYHKKKISAGRGPACAFHNGVFGKFEEEPFSQGTRKFMSELKRMHDAGADVYVGGGEGGTALHRYGDESWVTHCFTAGGTILKALGTEPIPYIKALYLKMRRK